MKVKLIENILSWQGEGPDSGRLMLILRHPLCNRVCAGKACSFCDTVVKMRILQPAEYNLKDIQAVIDRTGCGIMITGGEPTFEEQLTVTELMLTRLRYSVANIETNGYNLEKLIGDIKKKNVKFIWSPKIFSEEELNENLALANKVLLDKRVYVKMVVEANHVHQHLVEEFLRLHQNEKERIYLMPEGKDYQELYNNSMATFDLAEKYSVNFSSRNHLVFGFV
jgi:organic radical activating enzyme